MIHDLYQSTLFLVKTEVQETKQMHCLRKRLNITHEIIKRRETMNSYQ